MFVIQGSSISTKFSLWTKKRDGDGGGPNCPKLGDVIIDDTLPLINFDSVVNLQSLLGGCV